MSHNQCAKNIVRYHITIYLKATPIVYKLFALYNILAVVGNTIALISRTNCSGALDRYNIVTYQAIGFSGTNLSTVFHCTWFLRYVSR